MALISDGIAGVPPASIIAARLEAEVSSWRAEMRAAGANREMLVWCAETPRTLKELAATHPNWAGWVAEFFELRGDTARADALLALLPAAAAAQTLFYCERYARERGDTARADVLFAALDAADDKDSRFWGLQAALDRKREPDEWEDEEE